MTRAARTLRDMIGASHAVPALQGRAWLLAVDLHPPTGVTSPQTFEGLRSEDRPAKHSGKTIAVAGHSVPAD